MTDDQVFRAILTGIAAIVLPIGVYRRFTSQATREKLDRRQEGTFILATLRPAGAAFWFGTIAWLIDPRWMAWSRLPLPVPLRWVGVGLLISGVALTVWTLRCLGPNLTDTVVTRQKHTLVVHGPYRWVRHPFYVCAIALSIGVSLIAANWFLMVAAVTVFALLVRRTRIEEANLLTRFGSDYERYMRATGRFLPRVL
jgi:protein-S-isoprenylcysteine O-methyltransferase Ste14